MNPISQEQKSKEELQLFRPGEVRARLAPSPTGFLHVGNARTALFNYLFAKKNNGILILRIEDTDKERSKKEFEESIFQGLKWLGLDWQEGPDKGGSFGPYRQSERKQIYQKYLEKLIKNDLIYHCFCSEEDLKAQRDYLLSIGKPPKYEGKCRKLSKEQVNQNIKQGKSYVLRFKTPQTKTAFQDLLRGKIESDSANFGDMVVAKDPETPLYNLAVVIDDFEMKITHVIRGEDHIPNTPKQVLLYQALNLQPPKFLHLPLILGPDRSKLSKRHGAVSLTDYQRQGYLPEAMINFLALLGWNPGDNKEIFSLSSLIKNFSIKGLQKQGAVFNIKKLDWLNGFYLRQKSLDKLTELCLPYLVKKGLIVPLWGREETIPLIYSPDLIPKGFETAASKEKISFALLKKIIGLYQQRLKKLSEIGELVEFFFKKDLVYSKELLFWKNISEKELKDVLDRIKKSLSKIDKNNWHQEKISEALIEEVNKRGDRGMVLWPLRAALTGERASAGPFEVAEALGKEKTIERLKAAKKLLS